MGTVMAPRSRMATSHSIHSTRLCDSRQTRSPAAIPDAARPEAISRAITSASPQVMDLQAPFSLNRKAASPGDAATLRDPSSTAGVSVRSVSVLIFPLSGALAPPSTLAAAPPQPTDRGVRLRPDGASAPTRTCRSHFAPRTVAANGGDRGRGAEARHTLVGRLAGPAARLREAGPALGLVRRGGARHVPGARRHVHQGRTDHEHAARAVARAHHPRARAPARRRGTVSFRGGGAHDRGGLRASRERALRRAAPGPHRLRLGRAGAQGAAARRPPGGHQGQPYQGHRAVQVRSGGDAGGGPLPGDLPRAAELQPRRGGGRVRRRHRRAAGLHHRGPQQPAGPGELRRPRRLRVPDADRGAVQRAGADDELHRGDQDPLHPGDAPGREEDRPPGPADVAEDGVRGRLRARRPAPGQHLHHARGTHRVIGPGPGGDPGRSAPQGLRAVLRGLGQARRRRDGAPDVRDVVQRRDAPRSRDLRALPRRHHRLRGPLLGPAPRGRPTGQGAVRPVRDPAAPPDQGQRQLHHREHRHSRHRGHRETAGPDAGSHGRGPSQLSVAPYRGRPARHLISNFGDGKTRTTFLSGRLCGAQLEPATEPRVISQPFRCPYVAGDLVNSEPTVPVPPRYRLIEEVGQGGMAVVYRATDDTLKRDVAIKVLHRHLSAERESKVRLAREAQAVAKLRHDNILEIYDYSGGDAEAAYIVTEFIDGQTLKQFLGDHAVRHPEIAALIAAELAGALQHAHGLGVIPRDITPENVMIRKDGMLKLLDFGSAQVIDLERMTVTGQLLGSPAYMAPELVEGKPLDVRTDVFSVGILLYQMATGSLPFSGKNPHEELKRITEGRFADPRGLNPLISAGLARIIARALARLQSDRYDTMAAMEADLNAELADAGLGPSREELVSPPGAPA